jgi:probable rRNA maturation factor
MPPPLIEVHISSAAESLVPPELDIAHLAQLGSHALPACLAAARPTENVLAHLTEIEVTLLSDPEIAAIHGEFLDDPTPTDVITFHHGEILISLDTAARQAPEHGLSLRDEIALYLIHGLLHLAGWDDHDPTEATAMASLQRDLLAAALTAHPHPPSD